MTTVSRIFAVNTYSYTLEWSALDCVHHLADQGYPAVELMMYPGHLWPTEVSGSKTRAVRQACQARGVRILSINMPNIDMNVAGASLEMREYTLGLLSDFIRLGGELGARSIIVGPGKANPLFPMPRTQMIGHFRAALDRLYPVAQSADLTLLVENMPFCFMPDAASIMNALDEYGNPDIGTIYDVANAHFIGEDIGNGLRTMKPRLRLIHLSDTSRTVYRHDPIGHGDVPFGTIPPLLKEIEYEGMPILEVIVAEPDAGIRESAEKLSHLGFNDFRKDGR